MNTRVIAMTAAAFLGLATPALAGESTPAEKEATRQLNRQAAENARPEAPRQVMVHNAGAAPAINAAAAEPGMAAPSGMLSRIINPPSKMAIANVRDASGKTVGVVRKIEVSPDGTPMRVLVAMIGAKEQIVVLDASSVHYDPHKNEITATSGLPPNS